MNEPEDETRMAIDVLFARYEKIQKAAEARFRGVDGTAAAAGDDDIDATTYTPAYVPVSGAGSGVVDSDNNAARGDSVGAGVGAGAGGGSSEYPATPSVPLYAARDSFSGLGSPPPMASVETAPGLSADVVAANQAAAKAEVPVAKQVLLLTNLRVRLMDSASDKVLWAMTLLPPAKDGSNTTEKARRVLSCIGSTIVAAVKDVDEDGGHDQGTDPVKDGLEALHREHSVRMDIRVRLRRVCRMCRMRRC